MAGDMAASGAKSDAPIVARLNARGLVPLGVTAAPDAYQCVCSVSSRSGVTRNPWNLARSAGGSSSGAGAAVAAGLGPLHLGTDGGGSVRTPAAWCGAIGLVPGIAFSGYPVGLPGILARSVEDTNLLAREIAGARLDDGIRWRRPALTTGTGASLQGRRVGHWPAPSPIGVPVQPEVERVVAAALAKLSRADGFRIVDVPVTPDRQALVDGWTAGIAQGLRATQEKLVAAGGAERADPWLRRLIDNARKLDEKTIEAMDARYLKMISALAADRRLTSFDVIFSATMPVQAFDAGLHQPADYDASVIPYGLDGGERVLGHTVIFSLLGWVSASIPCGFDRDGMPVGLMIAVPPAADDLSRCLAYARRVESLVTPEQRVPFVPRARS
jgi:aspartyl-tRNA(Asn)/glutamyl-tRNA(Gln) amidotransferase subunit A